MAMEELDPRKRIIVAADVPNTVALDELLRSIGPHVGTVKLGLQILTNAGRFARFGVKHVCPDADVMYDGKFKDIPKTMELATAALADLELWAFTVHASAGIEGMRAAASAKGKSLMLAVTVLTTMTEAECWRMYSRPIHEAVLGFALDAAEGGADGLICAPKELDMLSKHRELDHLIRVVPGVRPTWAVVPGDDQNPERTMTPKEAIIAGGAGTRLVLGRPVTGTFPGMPGGPAANVAAIIEEIQKGLDVLKMRGKQ